MANLEKGIEQAIKQAISEGLHSADRTLLILTELKNNPEYGFDDTSAVFPHDTNGRLVFPLGTNAKGQRQYLISFDASQVDDPSHPDPGVVEGWDWEVYGKSEPSPILIILTQMRSPKNETEGNEKGEYSKENPRDLGKDPLPGFSMADLGIVDGHRQYGIAIDPALFNVQLTHN